MERVVQPILRTGLPVLLCLNVAISEAVTFVATNDESGLPTTMRAVAALITGIITCLYIWRGRPA